MVSARVALRRFLYISPYFPPQLKVGALRPLKLLRYLEPRGWAADVLCDLRRSDATGASLERLLPAP